jgi:hypothetical protein
VPHENSTSPDHRFKSYSTTALGACSGNLLIVDFGCKILFKGIELGASFSGALLENGVLKKVISHLHGPVKWLWQQTEPEFGLQLIETILNIVYHRNETIFVYTELRFPRVCRSIPRKELVKLTPSRRLNMRRLRLSLLLNAAYFFRNLDFCMQ